MSNIEHIMARIGFHASHEQFPPSELLALVKHAEDAGFDCAMSSDHFRPWGPAQGHSGFAWSWLGAALQATKLPFGVISAPGYRYHPAILAHDCGSRGTPEACVSSAGPGTSTARASSTSPSWS